MVQQMLPARAIGQMQILRGKGKKEHLFIKRPTFPTLLNLFKGKTDIRSNVSEVRRN